jgi:hypothetical protein
MISPIRGNRTEMGFKSWLGHVSITTTSEYIDIDMAMKHKAIERCAPPAPGPEGESRWHTRKDII